MPQLGIIRGVGEGEKATEYIIKLIKALRRRFRTKLDYEEIPVGNYYKHGPSLKADVIKTMRMYDCVFAGDLAYDSNPLEYKIEDIALSLDNNIEYTCIQGVDNFSNINLHIASYFDGGFMLREGKRDVDGCMETRICSTYSIMNIVKSVVRQCEDRRRRIAFVKDDDNEYCANLFCSKFESFTMPMSNFHFYQFSLRDIAYEIMYSPSQFDTIFASKTFAEYATGTYCALMKDEFAAYRKFADQTKVYTVDSLCQNSPSETYIPSMTCYIAALSDMLRNELDMEKEAIALNIALENTFKKGINSDNCQIFINSIIEELNKPLKSVYKPKSSLSRYVIK